MHKKLKSAVQIWCSLASARPEEELPLRAVVTVKRLQRSEFLPYMGKTPSCRCQINGVRFLFLLLVSLSGCRSLIHRRDYCRLVDTVTNKCTCPHENCKIRRTKYAFCRQKLLDYCLQIQKYFPFVCGGRVTWGVHNSTGTPVA